VDYLTPGEVARLVDTLEHSSGSPDEVRAPSPSPVFHPGRTAIFGLHETLPDLGVVGELHPRLAAELPFRNRVTLFEMPFEALRRAMPAEGGRFRPVSRYPAVLRDIAPRVPEQTPYGRVESAVFGAGVALLEELRLTDQYSGPPLPSGTKSFTLSLTLRAPDRTLGDSEVNEALAQIRAELESRCGATFAS
jgi:phenylalanyl-tRNA synthetase beta chain